jgi:hypothetical protein
MQEGKVNFHSHVHLWVKIPNRRRLFVHHHRFSTNVCLGILGDQNFRAVVLPMRRSLSVKSSLFTDLPAALEDVSLHRRQLVCLKSEAPQPHFSHNMIQHLNHWIRDGGQFNWPGRYPKRNPLNSWLWKHLKLLVCSQPISYVEVLHQRVERAWQEIRVKRGCFFK